MDSRDIKNKGIKIPSQQCKQCSHLLVVSNQLLNLANKFLQSTHIICKNGGLPHPLMQNQK